MCLPRCRSVHTFAMPQLDPRKPALMTPVASSETDPGKPAVLLQQALPELSPSKPPVLTPTGG